MKRCLSVLLSLTGVLLLVAVVSACKPEAREVDPHSRLVQPRHSQQQH